jgi:hypothetical protein
MCSDTMFEQRSRRASLALEFATLCRSIEDRSGLVAMLFSESRSDWDLGLCLYYGKLHLMHGGRATTWHPLIPCVAATTSIPPEKFEVDHRVHLKLKGVTTAARLLGPNL